MFTVSVIFWDRTPEAAVRAKVAELGRRRETDKVCRYLVAENPDKPGEYILEFIVSDGRDGVLDCVTLLSAGGDRREEGVAVVFLFPAGIWRRYSAFYEDDSRTAERLV